MANRYGGGQYSSGNGLGYQKLVDDETKVPWNTNPNGTLGGFRDGINLARMLQGAYADSQATEASTAASTEQTQTKDTTPIDPSAYDRNANDNYQLKESATKALEENVDPGGIPNGGEMVPSYREQYGLGANPTAFRDTRFTDAEKDVASTRARFDYHNKSTMYGARDKAAAAKNELANMEDRVEARASRGLQDQAARLALDVATRSADKSKALDTSMGAIVPIGSYVGEDGKVADKGSMGATKQTKHQYMQAVAAALTSGGMHAESANWRMNAATELNNETKRLVNNAKDLDHFNSTAYAQFNNGRDIVETKNKDGSSSFGHKGEAPLFESAPGGKNAFSQFKDFINAKISDNPSELPALHDRISKQNLKFSEIQLAAETKKEIAGLRAEVQRANVKEKRSETIDAVANGYAYAALMAMPPEARTPEVKAALIRDGYARQMPAKIPTESQMSVSDKIKVFEDARARLSTEKGWPKDVAGQDAAIDRYVQKRYGNLSVKGVTSDAHAGGGSASDTPAPELSEAGIPLVSEPPLGYMDRQRANRAAESANRVGKSLGGDWYDRVYGKREPGYEGM